MRYFFFYVLLISCLNAEAQDHTLNYFVEYATVNSPLLRDYQNQIGSNQVDSQVIRAMYKPQVGGLSNNVYAPVVAGFGYDNAITNGGQLSALVQGNKTFVSRNNLENQFSAIHLLNESLGNASIITEQDLKRNITSQYIIVYGDMLTMNFNSEVQILFQKEEAILKKLTQNNIYKQSDYLTFYVSLQQQQLGLLRSEIQFKNDYATLNWLAGMVDTSAVPLADPELQITGLPDINGSAFYRKYTLDSLKLVNEREAVKYNYKPKITLFADAGYNSAFSYQGYKNFGTSAGFTVSVPIYDGKQRQLKYKKIDINERTRQGYRDFFMNQYDQQIAQLKQQLHSTEMLIGEINTQIKYAKTLIDVNGSLLETGEVRIADMIIAINTYLNARYLLNQNYIERLQIINQINYWNRK